MTLKIIKKNFFYLCYLASLQEFTMHDTIGCYLDLDKGQISFSKNGAVWFPDSVGRELNNKVSHVPHFFLSFCLPGNDLGLAFEIPQHVKNQPFFAACVLKVWLQYKSRKRISRCHIYGTWLPYLCNRMQSWSSTLGERTLNMHQRVGSSLWTRHQRSTQSDLPRPVSGWCFTFFHNKSIFKTTFFSVVDTPLTTLTQSTCLQKPSLLCVSAGSAKVSQVKTSSNGPKALIIEPSKELAEQTLNNVTQFKKYVENPKLRYNSMESGSTSVCRNGAKTRTCVQNACDKTRYCDQ